MIEINLLPGSGKKTRSRSAGIDIRGAIGKIVARVKDPYLIAAVASAILAAVAVGGMFTIQKASAASLASSLQTATQDSIRFSAVIREKHKAEAERDSVLKQVKIIESFDTRRFVWSHIMDEVSRALPPYTWLKSIQQSAVLAPAVTTPPPPPPKGDGTKDKGKPAPLPPPPPPSALKFQIAGNTVDIQALTRFMKLLEASPFVKNVTIAKAELVTLEGKEVQEFLLEAEYERPDPSVISTVPVTLSSR